MDKAIIYRGLHVLMECRRVVCAAVFVLLLAVPRAACLAEGKAATGNYAAGAEALEQGNYNKALSEMLGYIRQEEKKTADKQDRQTLMRAYMSAGSIYNLFSDFKAAISLYDKCLALAKELHDETMQFKIYINLFGIYCDTKNLGKAEEYNEQIRTLKKMDSGQREAYYLFNKGYLAKYRNEDELLLKYMRQGIDTVEKYRLDGQGKAYAYRVISQMYERRGNLKEALRYMDSCFHEAQRLKLENVIIDGYKTYMQLYTKLGDKDNALFYQDMYFQYSDSLLNPTDFNQIRNAHQAYEQEIMELKMQNLEQTNRHQRYVIIGIALILTVIGLSVYVYRRQQKHINEANDDLYKRNRELLNILEGERTGGRKAAEDKADEKHYELLAKIEEVMADENNYCSADFSLGVLAAKVGSNTTYVSEVINNHCHKNFRTFINEYRIRVAMQRMGKPEYMGYSIQGLAESVGFRSSSNFVLAFKKVTGMTPSLYMEYAKKYQKED
ncbi:MAG: helix-turn-helix domain-containing protein [Prevotella sp.]